MKTPEESNRMIAEYMGATKKGSTAFYIKEMPRDLKTTTGWLMKSTLYKIGNLKYHSSIEWLYPVAKKLKEELQKYLPGYVSGLTLGCSKHISLLNEAAKTFEITPLFDAVVNGIEYLNKQKV